MLLDPNKVMIVGDLNFHLDDRRNKDAGRFLKILDTFGLKQHVQEPTHRCGHTLDECTTRESDRILHIRPEVFDPYLVDSTGNMSGDHLAVLASMTLYKPRNNLKIVNHRNLSAVSIADLRKDIRMNAKLSSSDEQLCRLVANYNREIRGLIDKHAPVIPKIVSRPKCPWYNSTLCDEKKRRRKLERLWRRTKLEIHKQMYKEQCIRMINLIMETKRQYYTKKIMECKGDCKKLFSITKRLLTGTVASAKHHSNQCLDSD